jgi:hypothetical protein
MFGLVDIPNHIRTQLVLLCLGAFGFNFFLEHTMRAMFSAPKPPAKGYMMYGKQLQALGISQASAEGGKAKAE